MIDTLISLWNAIKNGASALQSKRVYSAVAASIVIISLGGVGNFTVGCITLLAVMYMGTECWYKYLKMKYGDKE